MLFGENDGHAGFEDSRLFAGNLAEGVAEKVFVIEVDGGDTFEIGGMGAQFASSEEFFDQALDASESFGKGFLADLPAIDENTLVDLHEMRRSVQSGAKAGVAEDGFEESRGRAFAVGAGNMRAGVSAIGAAQAFGKHGDVFKV